MRTSIGCGLTLTLALVLALTAVPSRGEDVTGQAKEWAGTYKLVSGKAGDKDVSKERLNGMVTIKDDVMTTYDRENKEVYVVRYALEGKSDKAQTIMMTVIRATRPEAVGMKAKGLVKGDGKKLMLIYDFKGSDFPTDFEPKSDSQNMFVLERQDGK